ncbi:hypothetical protein BH23PAT2_BH23PAT2_10560 [soil metagenome]
MDDLFSPVPCIDPKSQKSIDDSVVAYPAQQREFVWFAIKPKIRDAVNGRWQTAKQFSEANFIAEFQTMGNFYNRLWEVNSRYLLAPHLSRKPGKGEPDLISDSFVVECVVPAPTDVPDLRLDGQLYNFPSLEIARRVTAALTAKLSQLNNRLTSSQQHIDYGQTPYIVAINLPDRNYMGAMGMTGMDIIEEVLIGAGPLQMTIDSANNTASMGVSSRSSIQSRNGSEISVGLFQRDDYKPLSAVLWTSEYLPEMSDLKLMLNPNATVPLDPSTFPEIANLITYTRTATGFTRDQSL